MSSYGYAEHLAMMRDARRMAAYREAIPACVRPGDVVLDLGAGAGVMTFLALEAGAAHVHAIDPCDSIEVLRRVARANGLLDRVTVHCEDSRRVRLPAPVDVVIADLRGAMPLLADGFAVVQDARARHLKPGGHLIPIADRISLAPVELASAHDNIAGWRATFAGADYSTMCEVAANEFRRFPFRSDSLLAAGAPLPEIRYDGSWRGLDAELRFEVERPGTLHGLGGWFEAELAPGVVLSTSPECDEMVYGQGYFPVQQATPVAPGDVVHATMAVRPGARSPVWTWTVRVTSNERVLLDERHCSFDDTILTLDALRKRGDSYQPRLGERGHIQRHVLTRMDEGVRLGDIARELIDRFPERFRDPADALAFVGRLSQTFSE